jgi:hypothetical protein
MVLYVLENRNVFDPNCFCWNTDLIVLLIRVSSVRNLLAPFLFSSYVPIRKIPTVPVPSRTGRSMKKVV